jgi:hypothetical protein
MEDQYNDNVLTHHAYDTPQCWQQMRFNHFKEKGSCSRNAFAGDKPQQKSIFIEYFSEISRKE